MAQSPKVRPWIFGYGSLIWRPAFPYLERRPAHIRGYIRRFWQASWDHRGTRENPGRVATLMSGDAGDICHGMAYRVDDANWQQVLDQLDYREKGGYERQEIPLHFQSGGPSDEVALLYIATPENPHYVGDTGLEDIAEVISTSYGPSGSNVEYLLNLAESLQKMQVHDEHVFELAALVERMVEGKS